VRRALDARSARVLVESVDVDAPIGARYPKSAPVPTRSQPSAIDRATRRHATAAASRWASCRRPIAMRPQAGASTRLSRTWAAWRRWWIDCWGYARTGRRAARRPHLGNSDAAGTRRAHARARDRVLGVRAPTGSRHI